MRQFDFVDSGMLLKMSRLVERLATNIANKRTFPSVDPFVAHEVAGEGELLLAVITLKRGTFVALFVLSQVLGLEEPTKHTNVTHLLSISFK